MSPVYITEQPLTLDEFEHIALAAGFRTAKTDRGSYVSLDVLDEKGAAVVWRAFENDGNDGQPHIEGCGWHERLDLDVWSEGDPEYRVLVGDLDEFMENEGETYSADALDDLFMRVGVDRD